MKFRVVRRGDVYDADLPEKLVGSIQAGKRPVVITQSNWLNFTSSTVIVAGMTSQIKNPDMDCHYVLPILKGLSMQTMVLGEQRFTIDKSLLLKFRCHLGNDLMRKVTRAIRAAESEDYNEKPKRVWKRRRR